VAVMATLLYYDLRVRRAGGGAEVGVAGWRKPRP
jgi:hypothetical protein